MKKYLYVSQIDTWKNLPLQFQNSFDLFDVNGLNRQPIKKHTLFETDSRIELYLDKLKSLSNIFEGVLIDSKLQLFSPQI